MGQSENLGEHPPAEHPHAPQPRPRPGATQRVNPFYGRGPAMKLFICFIMICIVGALPVSSQSESKKAEKKYDELMEKWWNLDNMWAQYVVEMKADGTVSVSEPKPQPPGDGTVGVIYIKSSKEEKYHVFGWRDPKDGAQWKEPKPENTMPRGTVFTRAKTGTRWEAKIGDKHAFAVVTDEGDGKIKYVETRKDPKGDVNVWRVPIVGNRIEYKGEEQKKEATPIVMQYETPVPQ